MIDWTAVITGVIAAVPPTIVALGVRREIRTPSGKSLGQVAEYAHDTAIANNLLLSAANGETKKASPDELREHGSGPPSVPTNGGHE